MNHEWSACLKVYFVFVEDFVDLKQTHLKSLAAVS